MSSARAMIASAALVLGGQAAAPELGAQGEIRSYELGTLVGAVHHWPFVLQPHGNLILGQRRPDPEEWDGVALFGGAHGDGEPRPPSKEINFKAPGGDFRAFARPLLDGNVLLDLLQSHLAAAGVDMNDGTFSFTWSGSILRVQAPVAAHAVVQAFLTPLTDAASTVIVTECALVPHGVLDKLQPEWRTAGPTLDGNVLEEASLDPGARLLAVTSHNGQRSATGTKDFQSFVVDQEVNQTGVIPVINPVVETPFAGDRLEVRALLVPGSSLVLLDLAVGMATATASTAALGSEWGSLDLPRTEERLFSTTVVVPAGKTAVAAALDSDRVGGTVVLVRSRVRRGAASPGATAGAGDEVRLYDLSMLLEASPQRRWPSAQAQERFSSREPRFDTDALPRLLEIAGDEPQRSRHRWDGMKLLISGPTDFLATREKILTGEVARLTQMAAIDLQVLGVTRTLLSQLRGRMEDGFLLPRDWEKALAGKQQVERRRCFLAGVAGQVHAVRRATVSTFVVGCSQISGGTGFAIVERSDPETDTCGAGMELRVEATFPSRADVARLQVEGCEAKITDERKTKASFPLITLLTGNEGSAPGTEAAASITSAQREIQLTLPRQAVTPWNVELELPLDRDAILQASAGEGETATVLIGRVRRVP